ncbi:hypothetical protein [Streptomyces sp. AcE210]|uniref:hypothetical protein n=1 Tax=Streptomyces sp. AcE210 TaxID=2292703 RepID=UPI0026BEE2D0
MGSDPAEVDPAPAAVPAGPLCTWETASPGYRSALAAHQEVAPPSWVDPAIAEVVERQTAAMRELSRRAFPGPDVVLDDASAPIENVRAERRRAADVSHAAALPRAGWAEARWLSHGQACCHFASARGSPGPRLFVLSH